MKKSLRCLVSFVVLIFIGCSKAPSCDDRNVVKLLREISINQLQNNNILASLDHVDFNQIKNTLLNAPIERIVTESVNKDIKSSVCSADYRIAISEQAATTGRFLLSADAARSGHAAEANFMYNIGRFDNNSHFMGEYFIQRLQYKIQTTADGHDILVTIENSAPIPAMAVLVEVWKDHKSNDTQKPKEPLRAKVEEPIKPEFPTPAPTIEADSVGSFHLYTIIGNEKVFFYDEPRSCLPGRFCAHQRKGYVLKGDFVWSVSTPKDDFLDVTFTSSNGKIYGGFIESKYVEEIFPDKPLQQSLLGTWETANQEVEIKYDQNRSFKINGNAFWEGSNADGIVHTGGLEGTLVEQNGYFKYVDQEDGISSICQADVYLVKNKIFIKDNSRCGGNNVTFSGFYNNKVN